MEWFRHAAAKVAQAMGTHWAFFVALGIIIAWGLTGPLFHFSDTWQLVINTGTTIITFLMVFVIQASQNRDAQAIQLKLDELIRAQKQARNVFADLEDADEEELRRFAEEFKELRRAGKSPGEAVTDAAHRSARPEREDGRDPEREDDVSRRSRRPGSSRRARP